MTEPAPDDLTGEPCQEAAAEDPVITHPVDVPTDPDHPANRPAGLPSAMPAEVPDDLAELDDVEPGDDQPGADPVLDEPLEG
jgi:hypothetical protein